VLGGKIYVSEKMSSNILESLSASRKEGRALENLTDREFEILQLLGQGKSTREIAEQNHLSPKTVEAHRANIKRKLNFKTGPELVRYAVRWVETQKVG
jgi:DNA-binding NarL/FixJ family response regulator